MDAGECPRRCHVLVGPSRARDSIRWHLLGLMAASPFSRSAGPGASGPWGLSLGLLLLLPLLLTSGCRQTPARPALASSLRRHPPCRLLGTNSAEDPPSSPDAQPPPPASTWRSEAYLLFKVSQLTCSGRPALPALCGTVLFSHIFILSLSLTSHCRTSTSCFLPVLPQAPFVLGYKENTSTPGGQGELLLQKNLSSWEDEFGRRSLLCTLFQGGGGILVSVLLILQYVVTVSPWHIIPEVCGRPWWSEDLDVTRHWPWEVSLRLENEHICGGALIELNWVVTAAHCIQGTKEYSVILGTSKLKPLQAALIPVKDIIMHPKFWGRTFIMGDVALLHLHSPATFTKYVQPICLPEPSYDLKVGTQCWVTGWGQVKQRFSGNSTLTAELQEAEVFIMDNKKCDQIYRKRSPIPHIVPLVLGDMVCATNYGENLCSGDSGGPLACEVEGRWILAGVLSWEKACARAENPGVYSRVTKYSKWIKKQISSGALSGPQTSAWLLLLFWLLWPQMSP
ncbi:putative serine protease 45 [Ursus americanus]|nr:putative serine protease 45 [Ursus americanus]